MIQWWLNLLCSILGHKFYTPGVIYYKRSLTCRRCKLTLKPVENE